MRMIISHHLQKAFWTLARRTGGTNVRFLHLLLRSNLEAMNANSRLKRNLFRRVHLFMKRSARIGILIAFTAVVVELVHVS